MKDVTKSVKPLHDAYCRLSGMQIQLTMSRLMSWEQWLAHGWTEQDLAAVIGLIRRKIKLGQRWTSSLHFRNLIENRDVFEEDLAEARSERQFRKQFTPRNQALAATGRPAEQTGERPARSVGEILAGIKAFADFQALKETL